jgi:hypothetical protein
LTRRADGGNLTGICGLDLLSRMRAQAEKYGATLQQGEDHRSPSRLRMLDTAIATDGNVWRCEDSERPKILIYYYLDGVTAPFF